MNNLYISNFEKVAVKYAEETIVNEEKQKYFLDGAKWFAKALLSTINSYHPMESESSKKITDVYTLRDVRKALEELTK